MLSSTNETLCFTGHRVLPSYHIEGLRAALRYEILRHYHLGVRNFISGGALGFDMLAAETVAQLKSELKDVKLIFAIPCADHTKGWNDAQKRRFDVLCGYADETTVLAERYFTGCMHARNRYMVQRSRYCISYCTKNSGGTYYTVKTAQRSGLTVTELSECLQ